MDPALSLTGMLRRPLRLVAVGDELIRGDRIDTNSSWLAERLSLIGLSPDSIAQLPDKDGGIRRAVEQWLGEGGVLILGGGLGPTADDTTREQIADALGVALREDPLAIDMIRSREKKLDRRYSAQTHRQALLPEGSQPIANPVGSAPAISLRKDDGFLLVLPGVPFEYRAICETLFPVNKANMQSTWWRLAGVGEDRLADGLEGFPGLEKLGFYPSAEGIRVRVPAGEVDEQALADRLDRWLVSRADGRLEEAVVGLLRDRGESLALAESCTGGLVGARVSSVAGASAVFSGGVVSYADAVKESVLGIGGDLIAAQGAVSEEVALQMARGAAEVLSADWGLSVTGIAGPLGAREGKPVGTVYLGLTGPGVEKVLRRQGGWDRDGNRHFAAQQALVLLWRNLRVGR